VEVKSPWQPFSEEDASWDKIGEAFFDVLKSNSSTLPMIGGTPQTYLAAAGSSKMTEANSDPSKWVVIPDDDVFVFQAVFGGVDVK